MVLFITKNSRTSIDVWAGALSWCKIHDWFLHNSVRLRSSVLIDRTTLWQEFLIHENITLHLNELVVPFSDLAFLDASIGMIGLWFQCISHISSYELFEQIWIVVECRQHFLSIHLISKFSNFGKIFAAVSFIPNPCEEIAWHEPTFGQHHQQPLS